MPKFHILAFVGCRIQNAKNANGAGINLHNSSPNERIKTMKAVLIVYSSFSLASYSITTL